MVPKIHRRGLHAQNVRNIQPLRATYFHAWGLDYRKVSALGHFTPNKVYSYYTRFFLKRIKKKKEEEEEKREPAVEEGSFSR